MVSCSYDDQLYVAQKLFIDNKLGKLIPLVYSLLTKIKVFFCVIYFIFFAQNSSIKDNGDNSAIIKECHETITNITWSS